MSLKKTVGETFFPENFLKNKNNLFIYSVMENYLNKSL